MKKLSLLLLLALLVACSQSTPDLPLAPTLATPGNRPEIPVSALPSKRVMVAIVLGQSNAGNYGQSPLNPGRGVYSFFNGKLYAGYDPLPGSMGQRGSVWTRLGRKLIARGAYDAVVLVPIGISSARMAKWTPGGQVSPRLLRTIRGLKSRGLSPTHLLWHHGETDASIGTGKDAYMDAFHKMLGSIRREGVTAPIYVSVTTKIGWRGPDKTIRGAQMALVNPSLGIRSGPDTDVLGREYRFDYHHFNTRGLDVVADLWLDKLGLAVVNLPKPKPVTADRYLVNFQETPADRLISSVALGSGVVHQGGNNPKDRPISIAAQPRSSRRIVKGQQAKVVSVFGSKRLTVVQPGTNTPSPLGGRIQLRFAPSVSPDGVTLSSLTLSKVGTQPAYMRFFYAGGGSSRPYPIATGRTGDLVLPIDPIRVRALEVYAQNAFAVDDIAFSD